MRFRQKTGTTNQLARNQAKNEKAAQNRGELLKKSMEAEPRKIRVESDEWKQLAKDAQVILKPQSKDWYQKNKKMVTDTITATLARLDYGSYLDEHSLRPGDVGYVLGILPDARGRKVQPGSGNWRGVTTTFNDLFHMLLDYHKHVPPAAATANPDAAAGVAPTPAGAAAGAPTPAGAALAAAAAACRAEDDDDDDQQAKSYPITKSTSAAEADVTMVGSSKEQAASKQGTNPPTDDACTISPVRTRRKPKLLFWRLQSKFRRLVNGSVGPGSYLHEYGFSFLSHGEFPSREDAENARDTPNGWYCKNDP